MRKTLPSALPLTGSVLLLASLTAACSTRPAGRAMTEGTAGGIPSNTSGAGNPGGGGQSNPSVGGGQNNPGAGQGSGGTGNGTSGSMGGTTPIVQDAPSCQSSPLVRANYLGPVDTRVPNLLQQLTRDEKVKMLSGGDRLADQWWTIDFDATGAQKIGLNDMPMRDGPRGVHQLNNAKSTTFAVGEARAAAFDVDLEYRVGKVIAAEMKAFKYDVMLAPTMNVLRHPGWGRAQETYGEDPVHVGKMAAAFVRGMQDEKMMACPKHFAVNNTEDNRGDGADEPNVNMIVDAQTLRENYLRNFQIVVEEADPACMMAAYNRVNGLRCTQSPTLLTDILRKDWGWTGMVVSDWWATVANQGNTSINAGLDLEMPDNNAFRAIDGTVPITRIDEAASRIINARLKFAHDTAGYKGFPANPGIVNEASHKALALETALKGAVLLKNSNILPLGPKATTVGTGLSGVKSIVVLGPDAMKPNTDVNTAGVASGLGDRGSSATIPPYAVSFFDGIKNHPAAAGLTVTSSADVSAASSAEVVIIPVTMAWEDEGEAYDVGQDRADLTLSGMHPKHWATKPAKFIADAAALNKNVIVLLAVGSAIVMEDWIGSAAAIVQTFYPGQEGGNAAAQLLFGDVNFSGKLPFTVAVSPDDYPPFQNKTGENATIDYFHGYRKFEKDAKMPRFWYGHGLSYTTYEYGDPKVLCTAGISQQGALNVEIPITNTGKVAGDEIVQLYIGYPMTQAPRRPAKELKAFARVSLEPGATKTVQFSVPARDMAYWSATGWVVEKGQHSVLIGPSADPATLKSAAFTIN
jgi:beta-glucosidase